MIFQRKKVASALAYMLGVGGAVTLIAAPAQAADIKVDVTGSNIKRVEGEGALPVQVLTREDIEKTGAQTAYDLLNFVSANNSGGNISLGNVIGTTTFSAQTASLRGLGGQGTLVLVNGKRVQSFSGELQGVYGVNLDTIPFTAIERVEVLKDGASAVYGSDAIGGVINFITRQDYQGYEASVYGATPTRSGGGDAWNVRGTAGWGSLSKDKYNIFVSASYQQQNSLSQADRNFSKTAYLPDINYNTLSGNTFPAYISTGGIGSPGYPACDPSIGNINAAGRCRFDPAAYGAESIPDQNITNVYGSGRYQFNADWQGYITGFYSKAETHYIIQPVPISDQFFYGPTGDIPAAILLPASSPFYPTAAANAAGLPPGTPVNVRYRCVECGNRDTTDTNEGWQGVAGVKGNWKNWDLDFDYFYSEGTTTSHVNGGFPLYSQVLPLLNSGLVNVFGPNSDAISQQMKQSFVGNSIDATSKVYGIEGKASADIYNLPAGPLGFAVGFNLQKQTLSQTYDPTLNTGDVSGFGGNFLNTNADRTVHSVFGEFAIPIIKDLEFNAAVRYDDYSDFGGTTNPKFSVRWNPVQSVLLRGSWGTGFIAPSLTQLFTPNTTGVSQTGLSDPIRCPVTGDANDCDTQFGVTFGGNPNLQPEKSTQYQFGAIWEPVTGFSAGADYFNILLKNLFSNGVTPSTILDPTQYTQYTSLVTRLPSAPPYPNLAGRIQTIDQRFVNVGEVKIQGVDVDLRIKAPAQPWGQLSATLNGTYYIQYDVQNTDGTFTGFVSNQLFAAVSGLTPRWKHYLAFNYNYGPWQATLGQTFQSSYIDVQTLANGDTRRVGDLSIWDLQGVYTGFKNWTLTLGVKNLFDTNPPLTNQNTTFQAGYDPSYYNALARVVYGQVGYAFK